MEKVDRILAERAERFAKEEEVDVRMNLMLTKLGTNEQKVQSCMDRLERVPSASQVRMLYREELHKQLEEVNVVGLERRIDTQARLIDELGFRVQEHAVEFK